MIITVFGPDVVQDLVASVIGKGQERAIASLNQYLLDPLESVLAPCEGGGFAIEVKSPLDLEA